MECNNSYQNRLALEPFLDERVIVRGVFERITELDTKTKTIRCALLQDAEFEAEGKTYDLGHLYVQNAQALRNMQENGKLESGDRLECNCRVHSYRKRLPVPNKEGLMAITSYGVSWPQNVKVLRPVTESAEPGIEAIDEPLVLIQPVTQIDDPVALVKDVQQLAKRTGGWDKLTALIRILGSA